MKSGVIVFFILFIACSVFADAEFVYDDHGKRDPFWPLVSPSGTILNYDKDLEYGDMTLEGVVHDIKGGRSLAIINGNVLKKNDTLGAYVIADIHPNKVILIKDTNEFILEIRKGK